MISYFILRRDNDNTVTMTPNTGAALFSRKDSSTALNANRPSSLKVNSPVRSPPSSSPIPVPSLGNNHTPSPCSPRGRVKQLLDNNTLPRKSSPQVQSCALLNLIYFRFRYGTGKLKCHRFLTTISYI